jgi:hypothetical protein
MGTSNDLNPKILAVALLWLRNHYEVGDPALRDEVIERIDRVLTHCSPTVSDMERFREMFPRNTNKSREES